MDRTQETLIYIEDNDKKSAAMASNFYTMQETKDRIYINTLAYELVMKYLAQEDIDVSHIYNLHDINKIHEEFDIADIMLPNIHIDVRMVYDENVIFIPKSHFEYGLTPDIYLVLKLSEDNTYAKFLGFFEPKIINKNNQNSEYYFVEKEKLSSTQDLKSFIENFNGNTTEVLSQEDIDTGHRLALSLIDHDIHEEDKKSLLKALLKSSTLRKELIDFDKFELLSYHFVRNENLDSELLVNSTENIEDEFDIFDGPDEFQNFDETALLEDLSDSDSTEETNNDQSSNEEDFNTPIENSSENNSISDSDILDSFTDEINTENIIETMENINTTQPLDFSKEQPVDSLIEPNLTETDDEKLNIDLENTASLEEPIQEFSTEELNADVIDNVNPNNNLDELSTNDQDFNLENSNDFSLDDINQDLSVNNTDVLDNLNESSDLNELSADNQDFNLESSDDILFDDINQELPADNNDSLDNLNESSDLSELSANNQDFNLESSDDISFDDINQELPVDNNDSLDNLNESNDLNKLSADNQDFNLESSDDFSFDDIAEELPINNSEFNNDVNETNSPEIIENEQETNLDESINNIPSTDEFKSTPDDDSNISFDEIDLLYNDEQNMHTADINNSSETAPTTPTNSSDQNDGLVSLEELANKNMVFENSTSISNREFTPGEIMIDINQDLEETATEKNDLEDLGILYNEQTGEINDVENNIQTSFKKQHGKKAIILATAIITALAAVLIVYTTMSKSNNNIAQQNNQNVLEDNVPKVEEAKAPAMDEIAQETLPKPTIENTVQQAQEKINSNPMPIEPEFLEIKKLSWSIPDYISYNDDFKNFLQTSGKSIRLTLSSDLLLATEYAYSNQIDANITLSKDGNLQDVKITKSSGSKQIDDIVLQTVKQTLNVVKAPPNVIVGDNAQLTLKIYL